MTLPVDIARALTVHRRHKTPAATDWTVGPSSRAVVFGGALSKRVAEQPTTPGLLRWLVGPGP